MPEKLIDIADVTMGYSPPGDTCNELGNGVPLLNGPTEFGPYHPTPVQFTTEARRLAEPGDLLFCVRGSTTGRMNWADQRYAIGRGIAAIRHREGEQYQPYVRACVEHQLATLLGLATGSTFPSVSRGDIEGIAVPDLDGGEQLEIAHLLRLLDEKIDHNRRTGRKLEGLARGVFKAWFVDFEPVKAKAAGATAFPGMPPETFAALPNTLPNTLQNFPLGPVPQGWEVRPLSEAFDVNPPRRLAKGADAPYLDMKNMPTDGHAPDTWERRANGSGMKFTNGDTLVARITPCLENGKTAYVDFLADGEVAWGSTEYIVLRPKPPLPAIFAYCLARMEPFRDYAIQNMSGTSGRQRVAAAALDHYHIAVPDAVTAAAFGEVSRPLFECIRASKAESSKLTALRQYLLPQLLTGTVRVESKGAS